MHYKIKIIWAVIALLSLNYGVFGNDQRAVIDDLCLKIDEADSIDRLREMSSELNASDKKYLYYKLEKNLSHSGVRDMFLSAAEKDPNGSVRAYAIRSLSSAGESSKEYHQTLLRILAEKPSVSRSVAAKAAASSRIEGALPLIIGLLGEGRLDEKVHILDIILSYSDDILEYRNEIEAHFEDIEQSIKTQRKMLHRNKNDLKNPHIPANRAQRNVEKLREIFSKTPPVEKNAAGIVSGNIVTEELVPSNTAKSENEYSLGSLESDSAFDKKPDKHSWVWFVFLGGVICVIFLVAVKFKR
ncbi:MAG: hypothetical protein H7A51_19705 [Akkermansiaceae bacterium]|nr:hypothetical protein [Akkermansiaceae bacterium]